MATTRLAHGWRLAAPVSLAPDDVRDFVRPALRAVPRALANSIKRCVIAFPGEIEKGAAASRWEESEDAIAVEVATAGIDAHDAALELLTCIGQLAWAFSGPARRERWLRILHAELERGVTGEIDEAAMREKLRLVSGPASARSARRLEAYAEASFAGTAAEYIHALWHDVHVRSGPLFLPPSALRRRLQTLALWFPPNPGYRLFPRERS
jgi:hypothetical protein